MGIFSCLRVKAPHNKKHMCGFFFKLCLDLGSFPGELPGVYLSRAGQITTFLEAENQEGHSKSINMTGQPHNSKVNLETGESWVPWIRRSSGCGVKAAFCWLFFGRCHCSWVCLHTCSSCLLINENLRLCLTGCEGSRQDSEFKTQISRYNQLNPVRATFES